MSLKNTVCDFCKKIGHLARVCRTKARQKSADSSKRTNRLADSGASESDVDIYHVQERRAKPYIVKVTLNEALLDMELDTGAAVSLISKATYEKL